MESKNLGNGNRFPAITTKEAYGSLKGMHHQLQLVFWDNVFVKIGCQVKTSVVQVAFPQDAAAVKAVHTPAFFVKVKHVPVLDIGHSGLDDEKGLELASSCTCSRYLANLLQAILRMRYHFTAGSLHLGQEELGAVVDPNYGVFRNCCKRRSYNAFNSGNRHRTAIECLEIVNVRRPGKPRNRQR